MSERAGEERAWVEGLRRGDGAAFDRVYAAYHARVFAFLLRLSGRRDTAEDLAQETWMKLARSAPSLREDTHLSGILFTIARNAFRSHRRWAMLDLSRIVVVGLESVATAAPDAGPDEDRARTLVLLEVALQRLPVASREVLLLVGVEELAQEDVARILGISYDAVRQRLHRARVELARTMEKLSRRETAKEGRMA